MTCDTLPFFMTPTSTKERTREATMTSLTSTILNGDEKAPVTTTIPAVIPPDHEARTLVLCFDGTGDQFDADNSNIVQLVSLLKKDDKTRQLVYYQVCLVPNHTLDAQTHTVNL